MNEHRARMGLELVGDFMVAHRWLICYDTVLDSATSLPNEINSPPSLHPTFSVPVNSNSAPLATFLTNFALVLPEHSTSTPLHNMLKSVVNNSSFVSLPTNTSRVCQGRLLV